MEKSNFFRQFIRKKVFEDAKFASEKRIKFNLRNILWFFGGILVLVILIIFGYTPDEAKRDITPPKLPDYSRPATSQEQSQYLSPNVTGRSSAPFSSSGISYDHRPFSGGGTNSRTRNASQVIKRGLNGSDPNAQLPMGTTFLATLLTSVLSTNTGSPVIAMIPKEVQGPNGESIPGNTKAMGSATFDDSSHRIQIHFSTLVYEDGTQHSIQAVAMMPDGSTGLDGDYHSSEGTRQLGKFLGNFAAGMADGMKDMSGPIGMFGIPTPSATIKNALLNGVSTSASDGAKTYSDGLSNVKASMSIASGFQFILFLEKEYLP